MKEGIVRAVLAPIALGSSVTQEVDKATFVKGWGLKLDHHAGLRISDAREWEKYEIPKGTDIFNWREFSAISTEELGFIQLNLELPSAIPFGCLGENLVIEGISSFSQTPPGSMLCFTDAQGNLRTTMLAVWSTNTPCRKPGENIQLHFPEITKIGSHFPKAAITRRGIVGFVFRSGYVKPGDKVRIMPP